MEDSNKMAATGTAWFRTKGGRGGPVRREVDKALRQADLSGPRAITAELARTVADLVDSAKREQDPRLWLTASSRLTALLGQLGIGRLVVDGDDGGGGSGDVGGLADVLGAGPEVRDQA